MWYWWIVAYVVLGYGVAVIDTQWGGSIHLMLAVPLRILLWPLTLFDWVLDWLFG